MMEENSRDWKTRKKMTMEISVHRPWRIVMERIWLPNSSVTLWLVKNRGSEAPLIA
jgi:hypothetical protein